MSGIFLDIGGGEVPKEGFINVDAYYPKAEVKAFADKLPYDDEIVDEIYSSHMLEHCGKYEIPKILSEWFRVLKHGGKLILPVPDLEWCCRYWLEHQSTEWEMDIIFGHQNSPGEFHKTGFNKDIGFNYLINAGFKVEKIEELSTHSQKTLSFECKKG